MKMSAALQLLVRVCRNALIDLRFGTLLIGKIKTRHSHLGSSNIENTDYVALSHIFADRVGPEDVLVDIGCGKGRVINWWLMKRHNNRIVGIELDEQVAEKTRRRLRRFQNVEIITGDAISRIPNYGTIFYLYNPFDARVMEQFEKYMSENFKNNRDMKILYYNPKHVSIFSNNPVWNVVVSEIGGPSSLPFSQLAVIQFS